MDSRLSKPVSDDTLRLTETARRGIPLPGAMQQSQHKSIAQASRYYNDAERQLGRAARLIV